MRQSKGRSRRRPGSCSTQWRWGKTGEASAATAADAATPSQSEHPEESGGGQAAVRADAGARSDPPAPQSSTSRSPSDRSYVPILGSYVPTSILNYLT